jgi:hypothetical protein
MVGREARADVRELLGLRIVHREVTARSVHRRHPRRRMRRSLFAESGICGRPHCGRDPHPSFFIEHRIVYVVLAGPEHLIPPELRRLRHPLARGRLGARIAHGQRHAAGGVAHGIQHRQIVGAELERAVDRAVRIQAGIPPIGCGQVVQVRFRIGPVPLSDDDVAFEALRPRRRRRHLTSLDTVGPVGEHLQRAAAAELIEPAAHLTSGLARLNAALPGSD